MNYPVHVGIIPDGCRRWAKKNSLQLNLGHVEGAGVMKRIGKWSVQNTPIKAYTIFALSYENLKSRPRLQREFLFKLYAREFRKMADDDDTKKHGLRLHAIGRLDVLPKDLLDAISYMEEKTKKNRKKHVYFALAYGGRQEIFDAVKKVVDSGKKLSEKSISKNLYTKAPDIDLIIRTSESRISNFSFWNAAYAEVAFLNDKLWPEVTVPDYKKVLSDYSTRQRRYGR
jgi:tritrans,polycis-undecaprenyl-diphosphate synthase [geranylgeranyl-diphosphate specific]